MAIELNNNKKRVLVVFLSIICAFLVITATLVKIAIVGDKAKINRKYSNPHPERRGKIFDRNGTLLASDLKINSLYINTILLKNPEEELAKLYNVLPDINTPDLLKKINDTKKAKNWILIKRNLTPLQVAKVNNLNIASFVFEDSLTRVYPQREVVSHIIGYVDVDRNGLAGMEMANNDLLSDYDNNLNLSIDIRVQDIVYNELKEALIKYRAKANSAIVMNIHNGEIIAAVSLPSFDANLQKEATADQRFNRVATSAYELGSIFKIFTNAIAFDRNIIKKTDVYNVSQPVKYGRFTINDDHYYQDRMTVEEVFAYSSNIGTMQIAKKIGIETQKEYLKNLNLLDKLEVDFPGLTRPIYSKVWREINMLTISYGHGIAVTPLHMASAFAAVVNGGIYHQPSFLKIDSDNQLNSQQVPNKSRVGHRVFKEKTSKEMLDMLRKVVVYGTGRNANIEGYEVGGKTGTANRAEKGGYNEKSTVASFIATFPVSNPQYLVLAVFDRPNYIFNTGGMVAAPVVGNIIKNIAPILGVKPNIKATNISSNKTN